MRTSLSVIRRKEETVEGALGTKNCEGRKKRNAAVSGEKWTVSLQFLLTCPHFIRLLLGLYSRKDCTTFFFSLSPVSIKIATSFLLIFPNMQEACRFHLTNLDSPL